MKSFCRLSAFVQAVLFLTIGPGHALGAGNFPEKPITLVVQAGPGGGSDLFARTVASAVEKNKLLPQPMVVENKPGGSGRIASAYVASKKGDPYFLRNAGTGLVTTPLMLLDNSPVLLKDFTPVANLVFDEFMLMVNAGSKYKSIKEIIADAKANPKKIIMGGTAMGGSDSVCAYLIEKATGVQFNFIVFNGGGDVNAALIGNHIDMAVSNPGEALELYRGGKVRLLGVFSEKRLAGAPEVPTLKEQGINTIFFQNRGFVAPAGIPAEARKVLEQAFFKAMKTDAFKKYCKENMLTEAWMDGVAFGKFNDEENAKYSVILKDMGLIRKK